MKGQLTLKMSEVDHGTTVEAQGALEQVSSMDKIVIINTIMKTLHFDAMDKTLLELAVLTNTWPTDMPGNITMDLGSIMKGREGR